MSSQRDDEQWLDDQRQATDTQRFFASYDEYALAATRD
jgi:hypothetical protein